MQRVLHSFPTRRSSDLKRDIVATDKRFEILLHERPFDVGSGDGIGAIENPKRLAHLGRFFESVEQSAGIGIEAAKARKDRKSTRLNSSHQIISYAVICL